MGKPAGGAEHSSLCSVVSLKCRQLLLDETEANTVIDVSSESALQGQIKSMLPVVCKTKQKKKPHVLFK